MKKQLSLFLSVLALTIICALSFSAYADDEVIVIDDTNTTATTYFSAYTYVGSKINPALTVVCDGVRLQRDVDFTVEYENDIEVGTGIATVTGIGNYSGTFIKEYPIIPVDDVNSLKFSVPSSVAYTGKPVTPNITITYRNMTLVKGVDYTVSYSSNINIGFAKAVIKGTGAKYKFTKELSFRVVPPAVSGLKFTNEKTSITLKWNRVNNVSGYQIMIYDENTRSYRTARYVNSQYTTSTTITGLNPSTLYWFVVRPYKDLNNYRYYGINSNEFVTRTRSADTYFTSCSQNGSQISLRWKTVRGSGYVIRYATKADFSNCKEIFINSSYTDSYTIKNINAYATYYVQIGSYTTLGTVKYYGQRSTPVSTVMSKRISYYSTYYPDVYNRTVNIKLACSAINGTVVYPGETFSFNKIVGPRTYDRGYREASVFGPGNTIQQGIGGGICQVASTLFNAALYADVQIVERHQHNLRVSYCPLGRDAAISWGSQDFRFKNTTPYPIKVVLTVTSEEIICEFKSSPNATIPSISLPVYQSGNNFTLKRYSSGYCNYTAYSKY